MSIGIGAIAKKVIEDDKIIVYEYGGINLNNSKFENKKRILDGLITIDKRCFLESEIHEKNKKISGRRKKIVTKRVLVDVDYPSMIEIKQIEITNCSNCWKTDENNIDIVVGTLLFELFNLYQRNGKIPNEVSF